MNPALFWKILQAILICGFPALAQFAAKRSKIIRGVSPVVLCYIFGILLVNAFRFPIDKSQSKLFTQYTVVLAIPLLLFSLHFSHWLRRAKNTALSIAIAFTSVMIFSTIGSIMLSDKIEEPGKIAGMLVGVYTGGTPNMSVIGLALSVKEETFIIINAVDVLFSALYLLFLMSVAQKLLGKFLPRSRKNETASDHRNLEMTAENISAPNILFALGLSSLVVALSAGLSFLLYGEINTILVILSITTFSIGCSFSKRIRAFEGSYDTGQYILLMFCVAIGTMADIKELLIASPYIILLVGIVMFGAVSLHYVLASVFKIDVDTTLITSTGAIFGPAFVGPIAGVLKNREVVISGLAAGLLGYALGNYLGIGLAMLLNFV